MRNGDPVSTLGYILTYVGLGVLVVSGWYGGHLVYVGLVGTKQTQETAVEGRVTEGARTPINVR